MGVTLEGSVPLEQSSSASGRSMPVRDASVAAWLVILPCAVFTATAIWLLGPWVGHRIIPAHPTYHLWEVLTPHPRELGRFVVALGGPLVLAGAIVAVIRRQPRIPRELAAAVVALAQGILVATVVVCLAGQRQPSFNRDYFTAATLVAAAMIALALLALGRNARLRRAFGERAHETWRHRATVTLAAAALTVVWMLHALNTDRSIAWSVDVTRYHVAFHMDETFALLNGLTPLATFTPQYGGLWPYVVALPLLAFGKTLLAYTATMSAITSIALLAIFGVLRRVTRNSLAALLLFLPFLATTLFHVRETLDNRFTLGSYFAMFPLRFAGPLLLAWLVARHLSAAPGSRRPWPLFLAAGLVVLNNADFGVAALGATAAALLWTHAERWRGRDLLRLAGQAAAGLLGALAIVSLVTLVRAGSLPQLWRLTEFGRIFGLNGFSAMAIPSAVGLPTLIYLTYVAAIGVATVRSVSAARDRVLTGMLAWTGVFGLGASIYYVVRADPDSLPSTFAPWTLAIALLAVAAFRALPRRPLRGQAAPALAVFFGLGLAVCSIAQFPWPGTQLDRLHGTFEQQLEDIQPLAPPQAPEARRFISSVADGPHRFVVRHGAPVAILETTGHRIADAYGVRDVVPYTGYDSILSVEQLERTLDALRDAGGNTLLTPRTDNVRFNLILIRRGFEIVTQRGIRPLPASYGRAHPEFPVGGKGALEMGRLIKWVDTRHLHPRALE